MRMNTPVTTTEYVLPDGMMIVSRTDMGGRILDANQDFIDVSGFGWEELKNQPHNLVRHPDMPPAAFADLWETLKAGKPWRGFVKNRRKNGDYYWVLANATPNLQNGQVTGYVSIRMKPSDQEKRAAEALYKDIRDGKAGNIKISGGRVRKTGMMASIGSFLSGTIARQISVLQVSVFLALVVATTSANYGSHILGTGATATYVAWAITAVLVLLSVWLVGRLRKSVLAPMAQLDSIFEKIGNGNYESRVEIERDDEVGNVLKQVEALQTKLGFSRFEMADQQKKAEAEKRAAMMNLAADLEAQVKDVVENVSGAAGTMQSSAAGMSSNAEQTTRQATAVAAASEEASTNVQTVAAATEELSSSVQEIGRQVAQSTLIASKAVDEAKKTDRTVSGLAESAQKIGEVVDLIRNIASQTNLLALNATIEAARAGDAGKGFAVVASEVKNLANQTAKATEDITAQIGSIQDATGEAVNAIKGIGNTIGENSSISSAIAAAVEEQNSATQEIARNVQQAAAGTQEVSSNIGGVTEAARGTGVAANDVLGAAQGLAKQADTLRQTIGNFLSRIRAA